MIYPFPLCARTVATVAIVAIAVGAVGCKKSSDDDNSQAVQTRESKSSQRLPTQQPIAFQSAIRSILHDRQGRYWFGSHREGVARLDDQGFSYFSQADGLPGDQIRSIQEDASGAIWLGTDRGVGRIDGSAITAFSIEADAGPAPSRWTKSDGDLWFAAGTHHGVQRYDGTTMGYLPLSTGNKEDSPSQPLYQVTGIAHGKAGRLWIATYAAVFGYDNDNGLKILDGAALGRLPGLGELHVRSILEDSQGNLWIGNNGLGVLLVDDHTARDFSKDMGLVGQGSLRGGGPSPQGTLEHVFAIEEDGAGNIWFGDRDTGAWKYDGRTMTNYGVAEGLPTLSIWDIHRDRNGTILVALDNGAVYRFVANAFEPVFPVSKRPAD